MMTKYTVKCEDERSVPELEVQYYLKDNGDGWGIDLMAENNRGETKCLLTLTEGKGYTSCYCAMAGIQTEGKLDKWRVG